MEDLPVDQLSGGTTDSSQTPGARGAPAIYPPPPDFFERLAPLEPLTAAPSVAATPKRRAAGRWARLRWRLIRPFSSSYPVSEFDIALLIVSAAVSFAVYGRILGWPVALGLIVLIFVHEMGHFVVIRAKGLPASLPIFIPFMGAFVRMPAVALSARDDAEIALAGPLAGGLGSVALLIAYVVTGQETLQFIAFMNLAINLFNLIPIEPLDGGRAARVINKWLLIPGLLLIAVSGLCTFDLLIPLVAAVAIVVLLARRRDDLRYYASRRERRYISLLYFGLTFGLIVASVFSVSLLWFGPLLTWPS